MTICGSQGPLRISDHCSVTVRVRVRVRVRIKFRVSIRVADCCIQTAGESDKMRISHVIKTDQWRSALQIRSAPHVVSPYNAVSVYMPFGLIFHTPLREKNDGWKTGTKGS